MADTDYDILSNSVSRAKNITSIEGTEIPATKQFVVNATGNLFIASTLNGGEAGNAKISAEAEKAFGQVSAFFAALTKAMKEADKSLFNFTAIDKLVSSSGLFVKVTESDINFSSSNWGVSIEGQFIQTLFGLSGNMASIGKSLMDMIVGMGKESISISSSTTDKGSKVGTIIFVCEYLLGAISIAPIVISADAEETKKVWEAKPCLRYEKETHALNLKKAVYLFVPPTFIEYSKSLNEAMSHPEFNNLVDSLKSVLLDKSNETGDVTKDDNSSQNK